VSEKLKRFNEILEPTEFQCKNCKSYEVKFIRCENIPDDGFEKIDYECKICGATVVVRLPHSRIYKESQ